MLIRTGVTSLKRFRRVFLKTLRQQISNTTTTTHLETDHSCKKEVMVEPQVLPRNNSLLRPAASNPSPSTPHQIPISTFPATQTSVHRPLMKFGNGACTHLTMTRLYTTEFRCSLCLRIGSIGWVYRCTQDRELLLEDDMERDNGVSPIKCFVPGSNTENTAGKT
jgi:hypothetical protein